MVTTNLFNIKFKSVTVGDILLNTKSKITTFTQNVLNILSFTSEFPSSKPFMKPLKISTFFKLKLHHHTAK